MTDKPLELAQLPGLIQVEHLIHWLPGCLFALYLLIITKRCSHPLVMIISLVGAIALFYLLLLLNGISIAAARHQGWTLAVSGHAEFASTWQSLHWTDFWHIH